MCSGRSEEQTNELAEQVLLQCLFKISQYFMSVHPTVTLDNNNNKNHVLDNSGV